MKLMKNVCNLALKPSAKSASERCAPGLPTINRKVLTLSLGTSGRSEKWENIGRVILFASLWSKPKEYPMNIQEKNETYVAQYALNELVQCDAIRSTNSL